MYVSLKISNENILLKKMIKNSKFKKMFYYILGLIILPSIAKEKEIKNLKTVYPGNTVLC